MRHAALLAVVCAGACQPTSQLIVHVDTDAWVPAMYDRLRLEVLRGAEPASPSARRDFAVDQAAFAGGRVSMGLAPPVGDDGLSVRARLYRSDSLVGDTPAGAALDTTMILPPLDAGGVRELFVHLHAEDAGRTLGPLDPDEDPAGSLAVGSWPGAQPVDCAGAPGANEACVPGGAFFMGDPNLSGVAIARAADRQRLVVLSPFYVDLHPATVRELRAQKPALQSAFVVAPWNLTNDPNKIDSFCTFTDGASAADPDDAHAGTPATCVLWTTARAYCQSLGKELPSEAQLEYLGSGRGAERSFVWGDAPPDCTSAVWGRGGVGTGPLLTTDSTCRSFGSPGVAPSGTTSDRVEFGGREVVDVAGNVSVWALDRWSRQEEAYWSRPGVFRDPVADLIGMDGDRRPIRGAGWFEPVLNLLAAYRDVLAPGTISPGVGVRCVRAAAR